LSFCLLTACSKEEKIQSYGAGNAGGGSPSGGGFTTSGGFPESCDNQFILSYNNLDSIYLNTVNMINSQSASDMELRTQLISLKNNCLQFFASHPHYNCHANLGNSAVTIGSSDFSLVCESTNHELNQLNKKLKLESGTIAQPDDQKNKDQPQPPVVVENQDETPKSLETPESTEIPEAEEIPQIPGIPDVPDVINIPESSDSTDTDIEEIPKKRDGPVPPPLIGE
jgi:hypothetical protein